MTAAPVTLCFMLRDVDGLEHVLLGLKKTGFGLGKVVGIGGHVEPGESPVEAICREVAEETSIVVDPADLQHVGSVDFVFPARPGWDMFSTVFLCRKFMGEGVESLEISPRWYPVDQLPLDKMWADSSRWLPAFLSGRRGAWRVELNSDNETVASCTHTPLPAEAGPRE
ncbi:8-oxo-dGTP diphosphatase [Specibacter sp. NPDC057265]|uniref:8-oxo-dGTP diphosphatase n=1 Tax=Specibacter sp. NPDC057265 TaxID=3346075 RepID=UPI0036432BBF